MTFLFVSTFYELGEPQAEVSLHIYTHVREETLALYGFRTEREKTLFERLLSVSGIGPKVAIGMLSGLEPEELIRAVRSGDIARLVHIPGVGRKTAERLILELRAKLNDLAMGEAAEEEAEAAPASAGPEDEVLSALVNLGYAQPAAEHAPCARLAARTPGANSSFLRSSLRLLARKVSPDRPVDAVIPSESEGPAFQALSGAPALQ